MWFAVAGGVKRGQGNRVGRYGIYIGTSVKDTANAWKSLPNDALPTFDGDSTWCHFVTAECVQIVRGITLFLLEFESVTTSHLNGGMSCNSLENVDINSPQVRKKREC